MPALHPPHPDALVFGHALRKRRKQLGWSQTVLAERMSQVAGEPVARQTITNYERGLSGGRGHAPLNLEWKNLVRLCEALESRLVVDIAHPAGVRVEFVAHDAQSP